MPEDNPAVLDTEFLSRLQRLVLEPADNGVTWPSGLWTRAEVLGYTDQCQNYFLRATTLLTGYFVQSIVPNQEPQPVDDNLQRVRAAVFVSTEGTVSPLLPGNRREADLLLEQWRQRLGTPIVFTVDDVGTQTIGLVPPPLVGGRLHLFGAVVADPVDGSGTPLTLPDEWVPGLTAGVLTRMYGKQGRAYNAELRDAAEARWQEALTAAAILATGMTVEQLAAALGGGGAR